MGRKTIIHEGSDFRNRPHPRITQTIRGKDAEFSLTCDFISPSHSDAKSTKTFLHPSPPFARIFLIERNEARLGTESGVRMLRRGGIYLLPPERPFEATYRRCKIKAFHVYLTDGFGFPVGAELEGIPEIRDQHLFDSIISAVGSGVDALWQAAAFQAAVAFCRPLFPELERRASLSPNQRLVLEMVSTKPPGELRVADIAGKLCVSRAALSKSFERQFKLPLKSHIINVAIRKAKELLLNSDLSVSEIAFHLGYKEPCYFQRLFKKQVGLTPLSYRKRGDSRSM